MKFVDMRTKLKVLVGVTVPLVLVVVLGGVSWSSINRIIETNGLVAHSNRVMSQSDVLTGSTFRMGTGLRGYFLAGQVLSASQDLATQSVDLKSLIEKLLTDVRAA